jgi:chromosome segregation ATPase
VSPRQQPKTETHLGRLLLSLFFVLLAALIFLYRQQIFDEVMFKSYAPSPQIAAINNRVGFSEKGTHLFYASQPELLDRSSFNNACRSVATEQTAVLGCYSKLRIYLFNIDNSSLDGVKEVTAAHEMLHAAYVRLSTSERKRVNALLEAQPLGDDEQRISELMAEYDKSEPGERMNELHSIVGSEIGSLNPELEAYYSKYFTDRSKVVALSIQYQSVFDQLKARQETLASELGTLADEIDKDSAVYKRNLQVLTTDIESFNDRASSGTMTREAYDSERSRLESRQRSLRSEYNTIQDMIDTYNTKRNELAAINSESQES